MTMKKTRPVALLLSVLTAFAACAGKPEWASKNDGLIAANNLTVRSRDDIPKIGLTPNLAEAP